MTKGILVIGGGISGIQATLDLADSGIDTYLVERAPSIGGNMAQLDKTFLTNICPACFLIPKMIACLRYPNIKLFTHAEVTEVTGSKGDFKVKILKHPRYVDEVKCVGCGICVEKCPVKVPDEFEMGLINRKAIYKQFLQSVPNVMTIDKDNCLFFRKNVCKVCDKLCPMGAIDYEQQPEEFEIHVGAIIVATGYEQLDPRTKEEYGYGKYINVRTAMEFERLICASGPTEGELQIEPDRRKPEKIAFIQFIGETNEYGRESYASSAVCMNATKYAILVNDYYGNIDTNIFYKDMLAIGKGYQEYINDAKRNYGIKYIQAIPTEIIEKPQDNKLIIKYPEIGNGTGNERKNELEVDLVVLLTPLIRSMTNKKLGDILGIEVHESGFFEIEDQLLTPVSTTKDGIFRTGYSENPTDISEMFIQASAAAAKAAEAITQIEAEGS